MEYMVAPQKRRSRRNTKFLRTNIKTILDLYRITINQKFFTDVDNYGNYKKTTLYKTTILSWGSNPQSVSINVYDNNWGMNNWYSNNWGWNGGYMASTIGTETIGVEWF
jgi:hypothetical protein